jgi:hypothetical protein
MRRLAFDGLLFLPKAGLGVGGFLLGTRPSDKKIEIRAFLSIACSYAAGPPFLPTDDEVAEARRALDRTPDTVLGCWFSRPRRSLELTETDRALFEKLCPGPGQVALIIRPSGMELARAALFYRTAQGVLTGGAERPLEPIELDETPEPEPITETAPEPVPVPTPVAEPRLFGEPEPLPVFDVPPPPRALPWRTLAGAALPAAFLIVALLAREYWMPRPALELMTAETNGHFSIEWNRAAVRGIDRGVLTIVDGKSWKQIPLTAAQLQAGTLAWTRQSPQFTADLVAGNAHATAKFKPPQAIVEPAAPPVPTLEAPH